jgi:1,4-dihydroxy-2-naphthoate octaprenyltransferase
MVEGLKPDLKTNRRIARTAILTLLGFSTIAVGLCLRLDWLLGVGVVVLLVAFFFTPRGTPSIGAGQSSS